MVHRYSTSLLGLLVMLVLPVAAWAQTSTVSGIVTSGEDGNPLPGASVVVVGTTAGAATGTDGYYEIDVPEGATTLRFSYIGFIAQEIEIDGRDEIDVVLEPDAEALEEIVVVGYGSQLERDVTGSIARVTAEEIESMPVNSFESAMQGRAPGVVVQSSSGKLGQGIQVRIRGGSSVSADNQPLYVVDGIPVITKDLSTNDAPTNPMAQFNPADIESVEVLKDASAAAIYGARGSNGVVLITTKNGYAGKTQFNVNYRHSASSPTRKVDVLNADEYAELYLESAENAGKYEYRLGYYDTEEEAIADWVGYAEGTLDWMAGYTDWRNGAVDTDWQDYMFQDGQANVMELSARGGDERTQFYASGSYSDETGIVFRDAFERITGRLNLDHQATDALKLGGHLSLARVNHSRVSNDNSFANPIQLIAMPPVTPAYLPSEEYWDDDAGMYTEYRPTEELNPETLYFNSLLYEDNVRYATESYRAIGSAYLELQLLKSLRFRSQFGVDVLDQNEDTYFNSKVARNTGAQQGLGYNSWSRVVSYTTNNFLTHTLAVGEHDLESTVGMSYEALNDDFVDVQGEKFPNDDFTQINDAGEITGGSSFETGYRLLGYFARANYKFKDRYLFKLSGRIDGSSRFGVDSRYGFFPSAAIGWIVSDEPFMQDFGALSFLKLRASYGLTGNAAIADFGHLALWGASSYAGRSGIYPDQTPNPNLQWERTQQLDVGFDYGFFNNRIRGELAYYRKNTDDLLLSVNVPLSTGYATQLRNVGKLFNEGLEFSINTDNLVGDFTWTSSFNIATNRNEITELDGQVISGGYINRAIEGEPIGVFYGYEYAGVDPDNGDALYYVNAEDGDPNETTNDPNAANRIVLGSPHPDFTGGFGNQFGYMGFELDVFFQFVYGNQIYDGGGRYKSANMLFEDNQLGSQMDRWQQPGDVTDVPEARLYYDNGTSPSSRYLYDGSYLRLKNVTLAYNVPQRFTRMAGVNNTRVYVTATNLLTVTDYPWWDPEVNADYIGGNIGLGNEFYSAPQARTISAGVQFGF